MLKLPILDLPARLTNAQISNHSSLIMLRRDGIVHPRFFLDQTTTQKVSTCGVWAVSWLNSFWASQSSQVLRLWINLIVSWKLLEDHRAKTLKLSTVHWRLLCSNLYHPPNPVVWETCSQQLPMTHLTYFATCYSSTRAGDWPPIRHWDTHMWPSSTTLRMSPFARAVLTSPSTTTKSFRSESTETNSTPTFTGVRRSSESASSSHTITTTTTTTTIRVALPRAVEAPSNSSVSSERPCHILVKRSKKVS